MNKKIFGILSALLIALLALVGVKVWNILAENADNAVEMVEYTISTADELYEIAELSKASDLSNAIVKLDADIVINEGNAVDWVASAPERIWFPIEGFAGIFDGQGHTISGLYGKAYDTAMGLFVNTKAGAVIRDFRLVNSYFEVSGSGGTAAISGGTDNGGSFEKIYTDAIIDCDGHYTAGIVNVITQEASISECWFDGKITRHYYNHTGGGIVAHVSAVTMDIKHCLNTGDIIGDEVKTFARLGGICGLISNGAVVNIQDCLSAGTIDSLADWQVGSVIGLIGSTSNANIKGAGIYATNESYIKAVGSGVDRLEGGIAKLDEAKLIGHGGYQWTNLNFDKYWAVDMESTPILKCFATDEVKLDGIEKAFDTTWYNKKAKEFTLNTLKELYGFALLSVSNNFEGKTIKLGKDITINEGKASDWVTNVPENMWIPIMNFAGTFDGQGHTISGLYASGGDAMGMFQKVKAKGVVKNFKLSNAYFNSITTDEANVGAIVGMGGGTFDTIYTDAVIDGTGSNHGGIIGLIDTSGTKITNCWFDGKISLKTETGNTAGGMIGFAKAVTTIEHSLVTGEISAEREKNYVRLGGMYGVNGNASTVTIKDCLSAPLITGADWQAGSVVGFIGTSSNAVMETVYATTESYYLNIGSGDERTKGGALRYAEADITGYAGYQWTNLDFEKYWAVDLKGIPILQSFAKEVPSVAGLKKKFDMSWYDSKQDTFTLKDAEDLYGMVQLSASGVNFIRKTVNLGANITVNKGDASTWATKAPANKWTPINNFAGTFNGKGHSISGLYFVDGTNGGLFGKTTITSTVKNLILENSYFANKKATGNVYIGGIASQGGGKFDTIYSDVIIETTGAGVGGIIAWMTEDDASIKNCWFAGQIRMLGEDAHSGAGMIGIANGDTLIENCLNSGTISGERTTGYVRAGGICGVIGSSTIVTMNDVLNVGKVTGPVWQIGSLVGFIGSSSGVKVNQDGVYTTNESCGGVMGSNTDDRVSGGTVTKLDEMDLKSDKAKKNAPGLNYTKYWTTLTKRTPVLKSFVKKAPALVQRGMTPDTSWYNPNATEYVITTAAQLYGIEELSYDTDFEGKIIKLGTDITINTGNAVDWATTAPQYVWEPIQEFAGTFDGQGHVISGLYNVGAKNVGLFAKTNEKSVIKNVSVKNSYFANTTDTGNIYIGSIAGQGGGKFERVYSNAIIKCGSIGVGGLVGFSNMANTTFSECWFDGTISMLTKEGYTAGGILGIGDADVKFINCLNSGTISAERTHSYTRLGGMCGLIKNGGIMYVQDCLNVKAMKSVDWQAGDIVGYIGSSSAVEMGTDGVYAVKDDSFGPVGGGTARVKGKAAQVFRNNLIGAKAATSAPGLDFVSVWAAIKDETPMLRYFASGKNIVDVMVADTSWYNETDKEFVIDTVEEFYGFAKLSLTNDFAGKTIKLGTDMIVNALAEGESAINYANNSPDNIWNPIGYAGGTGKPFAGTFDGQGYTISGIYVSGQDNLGLFGKTTETAKIKNFRLENSYFTSTTDRDGKAVNIGSVVGSGAGLFDTIYTDAIITSGGGAVGGIMGRADTGSVTMNNCQSAATINLVGKSYDGGGFIGDARVNVTLANCLKSGIITFTSTDTTRRIGGLIGYVRSGSTAIADSVVAGSLSCDTSLSNIGAIVGKASGSLDVTKDHDIYVTTNNHSKTVGAGSLNGEAYVHMISDEQKLYGLSAMRNADTLDFESVWGAVEGEMLVLRSFPNGKTIMEPLDEEPIVADTSWYNDTDKEFTITTAEQFYGFAELSQNNNFAGKTIHLGADIDANVLKAGETASDWATTPPINTWTPIGNKDVAQFAGTFDGHGYTISGIYVAGIDNNFGLFSKTAASSIIKNFRLVDSYFVSPSNRDGAAVFMGSIAGSGGGTFDTIYTEAIVTCGGGGAGAIMGCANVGSVTINNCWSNATINLVGKSYDGGGLIGDVRVDTSVSNCLNEGDIYFTSTDTTRRIGGLLGNVRSGAKATLKDSVVVGTLNCDKTLSAIGSIIGKNSGTVEVKEGDDVYTLTSVHTNYIGSGSVTGANYVHSLADVTTLYGESAKTTANTLDYTTYWKIVTNSTPILKCFETDTRWYSEAGAEAGTKDNPYVISNVAELFGLSELSQTFNFEGKVIRLTADITVNTGKASDWATTTPDKVWMPIGTTNAATQFAGTFDGQGHTISGIYVTGQNNLGFFKRTAQSAVIKNFHLENSYLASTSDRNGVAVNIGAITGSGAGTFETIYTDAIVSTHGLGIGGFIGGMTTNGTSATIRNSWFAGTLNMYGGSYHAGGFVGTVGYGTTATTTLHLDNCLNTGVINHSSNGEYTRIGGLCGVVLNGSTVNMKDCLVVGEIQTSSTSSQIGSLIGLVGSTSYINLEKDGDVYGAKDCHKATIGSGSNRVTGTDFIHRIDDVTTLYGDAAKTTVSTLDFEKYWETVQDATPILKLAMIEESQGDSSDDEQEKPIVADKSWYNTTDKEFTLKTAEQFYGFSELSNETNFAGVTIHLGADIVANTLKEGETVADWKTTAPLNTWDPIGTTDTATQFAGTFNGHGYTISGIYVNGETNLGLFSKLAVGSVIKNFRLENSYISSVDSKNGVAVNIGAVAGSGCGTFDSIYTNAIITTKGGCVAGFIGKVNNAGTTKMTNCWFAGTINMDGKSYHGGGFVGEINGTSYKLNMDNCLNTGILNFNSTDTTYRVGGMVGGIRQGAEVTMSDCLMVGTVNAKDTTKTGAIAGSLENLSAGSKVVINDGCDVYTTKASYDEGIGNSQAVTGDGAIQQVEAVSNLYGTAASDLDFNVYWKSITDSTPILKCFEHDIRWYTEATDDADGNAPGHKDNPYVIDTAAALYGFAEVSNVYNFAEKTVVLNADVVMNDGNSTNWSTSFVGREWDPIGTTDTATQFAGTFDGQGHTISGIYYSENSNNFGFFSKVAQGATITNFTLENSYFSSETRTANTHIGAIAGSGGGNFSSLYVKENVIITCGGGGIGGIIGCVNASGKTTIQNCWFNGTINMISGAYNGGGFIGYASKNAPEIKLLNCLSTGTINYNSTSTTKRIGGFIGGLFKDNSETIGPNATMEDCVADVTFTGSLPTSGMGAVIGTLENVGSGTSLTIEENGGVYVTTDSHSALLGNYSTVKNAKPAAVEGIDRIVHVAGTELTGTKASNLDFAQYWTALDNDTPVLTSFYEAEPATMTMFGRILRAIEEIFN